MGDDMRPQLDRWGGDQRSRQPYCAQVVVQVGTPAAVRRITAHTYPWRTHLPGTSASEVVALRVRHKHLAAPIAALAMALQLASVRRQQREVDVVGHRYQHVSVLGVALSGCQRA